MRRLGIPKKIIGKVILEEVKSDLRLKGDISKYHYKYN